MNDEQIEQAISDVHANVAPRVTLDDINNMIVSEHYFTAYDGRTGALEHETYAARERPEIDDTDLGPLKLLTFCVLVLQNGFTITGESACVSAANFNAAVGRQIARQKAIDKCWQYLGWDLANRLARGPSVDSPTP